ncbi:MAG: OsmC family protein [Candidatus Eisenbacteria bacterium]|nr:OsmC family protein [Candidatus Eisenbacteria bacterium]
MGSEAVHKYEVGIAWEGNRGTGTSAYTAYDRSFRVAVAGKPDLAGTADPAFRGDPAVHNPEELLVAAVASCHMLFYLSLCARAGIAVLEYSDAAQGTMQERAAGGGQFTGITLRPRVTVAAGTDLETAEALHVRANELCFIANSCNFPIRHHSEVRVA